MDGGGPRHHCHYCLAIDLLICRSSEEAAPHAIRRNRAVPLAASARGRLDRAHELPHPHHYRGRCDVTEAAGLQRAPVARAVLHVRRAELHTLEAYRRAARHHDCLVGLLPAAPSRHRDRGSRDRTDEDSKQVRSVRWVRWVSLVSLVRHVPQVLELPQVFGPHRVAGRRIALVRGHPRMAVRARRFRVALRFPPSRAACLLASDRDRPRACARNRGDRNDRAA